MATGDQNSEKQRTTKHPKKHPAHVAPAKAAADSDNALMTFLKLGKGSLAKLKRRLAHGAVAERRGRIGRPSGLLILARIPRLYLLQCKPCLVEMFFPFLRAWLLQKQVSRCPDVGASAASADVISTAETSRFIGVSLYLKLCILFRFGLLGALTVSVLA
jgi:hypothetical protein